eukprot:COSAG02_NODE_29262_length_573_cov_0.402954_1_plen_39_part_01
MRRFQLLANVIHYVADNEVTIYIDIWSAGDIYICCMMMT